MADQKGPGFKDIGDLRAKLGLSTPAKAQAPAGEDAPTMPASDAMIEEEDEATSIVSAIDEAAEAAMDAAIAGAGDAVDGAPALAAAHVRLNTPQPGAPAGVDVDPPTVPVSVSPLAGGAIPPPSADAPMAGYVSPSADSMASVPPPAGAAAPLPAPPQPAAAEAGADPGMASPFARSSPPLPQAPSGPLAPPPPGAIGIDMGDATIAAFAPLQRQTRKAIFVAAGVVGTLALGFGYLSGNTNKDRIIINKRIADADRLVKPLKASVAEVKSVLTQIKRADSNKVNWKLAETLMKFDAKFKIDEMYSDNLLVGPTITNDLIDYAFLSNKLQEAAASHAKLTLKKHKKFLEDFEKGNASVRSDKPMFVYHADGKGMLVTVEAPPRKDGRKEVVPIRTLSGAERVVELKDLIAIDKRDLIGASGPNVMELYSARIKGMQRTGALLDKQMDGLILRVQKLADQSPVFAL